MTARGRLPEVLAPVGSPQALDAALGCGADAVYLGIDTLNARRNAENFTVENLAQVVRRCHIRGVRVYLTLNIVLLENELPALLRAAKAACAAGVDAVIVQDLGVAAILRQCAPKLRLHGSTQMAVHNPEGARILEDLGFQRVVLARECSREEIARICASTSMEVEVFVHGALCMCVSGQCYMSSVLGQRSGNRGLCAQPCRLEFSTSASDHALSLKDMSLLSQFAELRETGVASLKIEGRMKRPEYVAAAVTACRAALAEEPVDLDSLQAVFSRSGFTSGYFDGRLDIDMFGIRAKEDVAAASGVLGKLENLYTDPRKQVQKVDTEFAFTMRAGEAVSLLATDCDGNAAHVYGELPQTALNKPTDAERASASLSKTGGTPYRVCAVSCDIGEGLMLPASSINALRRAALEELDALRGEPKPLAFDENALEKPRATGRRAQPALRIRAQKAAQVTAEMLEKAELVTLPLGEAVRLSEALSPEQVKKLCAGVPRMLFQGQTAVEKLLEQARTNGIEHASVGNLGALELARRQGLILHGEPFFNVVNSYAVKALADLGLCDLTLSFELNLEGAKRLASPIPLGVTAYGYLPLMTVRNCPVKAAVGCVRCRKGENAVTDRKGNKLRTSCAWGCSELYNPVPLYLGDRLGELKGLDFYTLEFSTENTAGCEKILHEYERGGCAPEKFTRGLLYKTLL